MKKKGEIVYLLHFDRAIGGGNRGQAQHYIGRTIDLDRRTEEHRAGQGARLPAAFARAGIDFKVAETWTVPPDREGFEYERALKNLKQSSKICPICQGV